MIRSGFSARLLVPCMDTLALSVPQIQCAEMGRIRIKIETTHIIRDTELTPFSRPCLPQTFHLRTSDGGCDVGFTTPVFLTVNRFWVLLSVICLLVTGYMCCVRLTSSSRMSSLEFVMFIDSCKERL